MGADLEAFKNIHGELGEQDVKLVAVSKTKPDEDILSLYNAGQKAFGENYVQELTGKAERLPKDIEWHFIGHLQSNKVKYLVNFIHLIQGVDSFKLLKEINKQAAKIDRKINCILQIHIATEESKFGLNESELGEIILQGDSLGNVSVIGLMGMASFSSDTSLVKDEFRTLHDMFKKHIDYFSQFTNKPVLSMGMSGDYKIAIEHGSNLVRIGSLLFGKRDN